MTTIEQECSRHNQSTSQKLNDSQGATIELDNPLSNSYGNEKPTLFLASLPTCNLNIVLGKFQYYITHRDLFGLLVNGRSASIWCGEMLEADSYCSRHPDGTAIILKIGDLEFIIPYDRFDRVARAEVPGLVVRPAGVSDV